MRQPAYQTEVLLVDAANFGEDDDAPDKTALEARLAAGASGSCWTRAFR